MLHKSNFNFNYKFNTYLDLKSIFNSKEQPHCYKFNTTNKFSYIFNTTNSLKLNVCLNINQISPLFYSILNVSYKNIGFFMNFINAGIKNVADCILNNKKGKENDRF